MSRLEEIKKEIALKNKYDTWEDYWVVLGATSNYSKMQSISDEVTNLYAKECSQASLEKASESAKTQERIDEKSGSYHWVTIVVDKESITNPENIVLL